MKKNFCIVLFFLFVFSVLTGCSGASFLTSPTDESASHAIIPSVKECESARSESTLLMSEDTSTSPKHSFPELSFEVNEICWGGELIQLGTSTVNVGGVNFLNCDSASYCLQAEKNQPVAFFLSLNFISTDIYHTEYLEMISQLEGAEENPKGITHQRLIEEVFDEKGVYDPAKGDAWISDLRFAVDYYQNLMDIGQKSATDNMKADWKERCAKKGITCVDTNSQGLWIFCTRDQLASMVLTEEARFLFYRLSVPTQDFYSTKREQIVK